jgi:protein SCO1/2
MLISLLTSALLLISEPARPGRLANIAPAPPTVLVDSAGKRFDLTALKGKLVLVSFVYTTCNGACPLTTAALGGIQKALQKTKRWKSSVEFVSISLDPRRDRPEVLREYARRYAADPAAWHFLTGSTEDVDAVLKGWDMWVRSNPTTGVLDHPSRIFLLDPRGREREIYNLEFLDAQTVVNDVEELLGEGDRK